MLDLIWKDPPDDCRVKFPVLDRRVVGRIVLDPQHIGVPVFSGRALDLEIIFMKTQFRRPLDIYYERSNNPGCKDRV